MTKFRGEVKFVKEKEINTKRGPSNIYSFLVEDEQKGDSWVNTGFDRPDIKKNDVVEFEAEKNKFGYQVSANDVEVVGHNKDKFDGNTSTSHGTKDDYWSRREQRDYVNDAIVTLVGARNSAINFVNMLFSNGLVQVQKTEKKRQAQAEGLVEHYVSKFLKEAEEAKAKVTGESVEEGDIVQKEDATDDFED